MAIKWNTSKADAKLIDALAERAAKGDAELKTHYAMNLVACHLNGCPLDLHKLASFDDFNFWHDISGIDNHLDRETGKLMGCFVPRCSAGSRAWRKRHGHMVKS